MNSSKTKVIYTSTQYRLDRLPRCGNDIIGHVDSYVYLGIHLDAGMSLNLYASHLYNKIQIKLFTLSKIRKFIDKDSANIVYKQTILPILHYVLFDSCTQKARDDLQKLQNKALRIMLWFSKVNINLQKRSRHTQLQGRINFKVQPLKTRRNINSYERG